MKGKTMTTITATLSQKSCTPCQKGATRLQGEELQAYVKHLPDGWTVVDGHHLKKEFKFPDFVQALDFVNTIGSLAEAENHHPDILLTYGKATITLWTHKINGLHENDFILAEKIEHLTA